MKNWLKALLVACVSSVMLGCGGGSDSSSTPPPATPQSLSVEPGDATTVVQWPAVAGATSYNLYWSDTSPVTKDTAEVIKGAVSPYRHTGRTNGKLLYYAVTAVNSHGESALSAEVGAMPVAPIPAAPATVNATPSDEMVTIAWAPVSRADSYNLYWSTSAGPKPGGQGVTRIANIRTTSYAHVGLTNGTRLYYVVTAVSTGGESVASAEVSATPLPPAPGAPANLTGTTGDEHVHLSWSATDDAISYNVYRSEAAGIVQGGAGVTKTSGITKTSYEPSGLTNGKTYHFRVSAVGSGGESALSDEIAVRPLPPAPPAPLGLTATALKDVVQVNLQWFDVTDYPSASAPIQPGYNLYRGAEPGLASYYKDSSRATKIANVTAPFVDAAVSSGTTYYYVVTSFVPALPEVESVPSGEVSATTGRAGGSGGGGEGETGFGTNLSFPLVFADGYGLAGAKISGTWPGLGPFATLPALDYNTGLRPLSTETPESLPFLSPTTAVSVGSVTYYPQASESTWQAEWRSNTAGDTVETIVDWGDALISRSYTTSSIVRVETTLKQDATIPGVTDTMSAYKMKLLSGSRTTELQGTDGTTYASAARNVFAINARLKIEKINTSGGADIVIFDKAVYESFGESEEGEGGSATTSSKYGAEINMAGSVVYGYNFRLGSVVGIADKRGQYRITFSLDPAATVGTENVANHVKMVGKSDAGATLASDGLSTSVVITVN